MTTYHEFNHLNPGLFRNPVATIGFFDGVHRGHIFIIRQLIQKAKKNNGEPVLLTLWPHPKTILNPSMQIKLLNSLDEKIELLSKTGIRHLVVIPFDQEFAQTSSYDFIKNILVDKIGLKGLLMGFDNHLGHNRDNYDTIANFARNFNIDIEKSKVESINRDRVSSSKIREMVENGIIDKANNMLGYNYTLSGIVTKGNQIGRTIGFPTANLTPLDPMKIIPSIGVYAVMVRINQITYMGMANIGYRPTLEGSTSQLRIEANLFNFDKDIYDQQISIEFVSKMREEKKFSSLNELSLQLNEDRKMALKILTD